MNKEEVELLDEGLDLLKHRIEEKIRFNKGDLEVYKKDSATAKIVQENLAEHQDKLARIIALQTKINHG